MRRTAPLRVLISVPEPRPTTNPYIVMLADALRSVDGVVLTHFSWDAALRGDYDVFHMHWPEAMAMGSDALRSSARHARMAARLARLRVRHVPMVRTLHNPTPHESISRPTRALLAWADRYVAVTISLNTMTPGLAGVPNTVIAHGHYIDWYSKYPVVERQAGRLVTFGAVRAYKGIEGLIGAVRDVEDAQVSLHVMGTTPDLNLAASLRRLAENEPRIRLDFGFVPDADLVAQVTAAELVVLPYVHMHNSGALLAALSLGRPVLVPANPITDQLAQEVGSAWIQRYPAEMSPSVLVTALENVAESLEPDARPDLSARDWALTGAQHVKVYRQAVERSRHPGVWR